MPIMKKLPKNNQKLSEFGRDTVSACSDVLLEQTKNISEASRLAQSVTEIKRTRLF